MSSLRPTATAFVPSSAASATAQTPDIESRKAGQAAGTYQQDQQQQHQQRTQQTQLCAAQDDITEDAYGDEDGYTDEAGNWVQCGTTSDWTQEWQQYSSSSPWQEQQLGATEQEEEDTVWQCTDGSSEQAMQLLHSWFPSQPLPLLRQLLEACDGHLQEALQIVSEMDREQQQEQAHQQTRSLAQLPRPNKASAQPVKQQQQELSLQDDKLFPTLLAAAEEKEQPQPPAAEARHALHQAGNLWDDNAVTRGTGSTSSTSSWSALARAAAAPSSKATSTPASTGRTGASTGCNKLGTSSTSSNRTAATGLDAAEQHAVPWVQTGEAVAQEYAAARAEASDYARVRNACFQQATQAYLAGNKALAKELSAKGKAAAQQMWAAHERASQQIYQQRNAQLAAPTATASQRGSNSSSSTAVIDLHGLHVREVQLLLPQQLAALKQHKQQSVSIIVGTGNHTKGPPSARVGPAVEALLQELGFSYKQPQPGLLRVQLA